MKRWKLVRCIFSLLFFFGAAAAQDRPQVMFWVDSKVSLMRIGVDPHPINLDTDTSVASLVLEAIENRDRSAARQAIRTYDRLIGTESRTRDYYPMRWICKTMIATEEERRSMLSDELTEDFYHFFTDSSYKNLKDYLLRKYRLNDYTPDDPEKHVEIRTYLEDLLMFNDPNRDLWDRTGEMLRHIPVNPGDRIMDIGCGFGYFSYQFSKKVGDRGRVFAVDTQEPYIDYIRNFVRDYGIDNITPVVSTSSDVSVSEQVDVAFMCSVYHIIYGWSREDERTAFLNTLKRALKRDGLLVIADNNFQNGEELNNCYVDRDLVVAQLAFHGFSLENHVEISPQRYLLVFRHRPADLNALEEYLSAGRQKDHPFRITSANSIVHIGSLDSYDITEAGIAAAKLVLDALESKNIAAAEQAVRAYDAIIPKENFGGEYTCLQWFCEYLAAENAEQQKMLEEPLTRAYFHYLADEDYKLLKEYVKYKYRLGKEEIREEEEAVMTERDREIGRTRRAFLEDFILFNNPRRESWEKSSVIMKTLDLAPNTTIADIGCGSGYYTWKFSQRIGNGGKVYAIDTKEEHLDFINDFVEDQHISNIETILTPGDRIELDTKVDLVFMCSLYHTIYGVSSEPERESLIISIKNALKDNGRLIIVDNGPVSDQELPYHGPYISRELIEYQLAYYGFALERYDQIIPQRYMLTFRLQ